MAILFNTQRLHWPLSEYENLRPRLPLEYLLGNNLHFDFDSQNFNFLTSSVIYYIKIRLFKLVILSS